MKQKLLLLDLLLLVLVIIAGTTLSRRWDEARAREHALLAQRIPPIPAPAIPPIPPVRPAQAVAYVDVAQKMLFAKDRNPTVILDPVVPPAPKQMPALPQAHGYMGFGETPTVILSEKPGAPHKSYRPGERIGDFKLLAVNNTHILFEWEGLRVLRKLEEITEKNAPPAPAQASAAAAPAAAPAAAVVSPSRPAPGIDLGNDSKACLPGDNSPAGTIADGFRKVVTSTPFGSSCRWERVR